MTWKPEPRVVIGGRDYTGQTVGRMLLSRGRADVDATPSAARGQVVLLDVDGGALQLSVGESMELWVTDSAGVDVQVFGGHVERVSLSTVATGSGGALVTWQVSGSGPLSRLNRRSVLAAGRPSEDDGERVAAAISDGLAVRWEEYSASTLWNQVGASMSWGRVDPGYDPDLIDDGVYDLTALPAQSGGYNPLTVAGDAAFSARGVLFETRDGFIGYADANRRVANGTAVAVELPTSVMSESGLGFQQILTSLANRVTVSYDGGAYTASDEDSIRTFGIWQTELDTQLANASAGSAVAEEWVFDRAFPAFEVDEIRLLLNNAGTALRDSLLRVEPNDPLMLTGMPGNLPVDTLFGFVESVEMSVDQFTAELTLGVSDAALSIGAVRWGAVGTAVTWASVGTALIWADARSV